MRSVDLYELLFRGLLSRSLSQVERDAIELRFGNADVNPEEITQEIMQSDEFFSLHRESFIVRQFPRATVVTAAGPLGHLIHCDLRQMHLGLSMVCGHYEPNETSFLQQTLKKGMCAVDVGANIGYFTTMMGGLVGDAGKVIAIEPVLDTFLKLQSAVFLNRQSHIVEMHNVAASDTEGFCELAYDNNSVNMGGVSIRIAGSPTAMAISQVASTKTIDEILWRRPVDFIKMDVEGAEGMALDGAHNTLRSFKPVILMEFNKNQLQNVSGITCTDLFKRILAFGYEGFKLMEHGVRIPISYEEIQKTTDTGDIVNVVFSSSEGNFPI